MWTILGLVSIILFCVFIMYFTSTTQEPFTVIDTGKSRNLDDTPYAYRLREYSDLSEVLKRPLYHAPQSSTAKLQPVHSDSYPIPYTTEQEQRFASGPASSTRSNKICSPLSQKEQGTSPYLSQNTYKLLPMNTFQDIPEPDRSLLTPKVLSYISRYQPYMYGTTPYIFSYYGTLFYYDYRYPRQPLPVHVVYQKYHGKHSKDTTHSMETMCHGVGLEQYPCYIRYQRRELVPIQRK